MFGNNIVFVFVYEVLRLILDLKRSEQIPDLSGKKHGENSTLHRHDEVSNSPPLHNEQ